MTDTLKSLAANTGRCPIDVAGHLVRAAARIDALKQSAPAVDSKVIDAVAKRLREIARAE